MLSPSPPRRFSLRPTCRRIPPSPLAPLSFSPAGSQIEKRTRIEIEDKKEELRLLVGGSYRDLLSTADQARRGGAASRLPPSAQASRVQKGVSLGLFSGGLLLAKEPARNLCIPAPSALI